MRYLIRELLWRRFGAFLAVALLLLISTNTSYAQELSLPFTGRWFVAQGGDTRNVNHHMTVKSQWFGVDFAKVSGPGNRALSLPNAKRLKDFFSWDEPVLSPVDGEVISVVNHLPDNPLGSRDTSNPAGNHVVIKTADSRFIYLAHFQRESFSVAEGERVRAGQLLGKCGNSGNSHFPHIHMHIQDSNDGATVGQNPIFSNMNVELTGKTFEAVTWPVIRGMFVMSR